MARGNWRSRRRLFAVTGVLVVATGVATVPWTSSSFRIQATRAQAVSTARYVGTSTARASDAVGYSITGVPPGGATDWLFNILNDGSNPPVIAESATTSSSTLLDTDATNGLRVQLDVCSTPWQQSAPGASATCNGTLTAIVAATALATSNTASPTITTGLAALHPGGLDRLRVRFSLPSGAPGTYQTLTSTPTVTLWGAPSAPQSVVPTAGDGQISVSWLAPTNVDGAAITYKATLTPGGASCTTATLTCTIPGLTDGVTESVTVTASDSHGTSLASPAIVTTPYPAVLSSPGGASLWLDAADPSTEYTATCGTGSPVVPGGAIGCWKDKSIKAENFGAAGSQPVLGTLNLLGAVNFTSPSQVLTSLDATDTYQTIFVSVLPVSAPTGYTYLFGQSTVDLSLRLANRSLSAPYAGYDWAGGTGPPALDWSNGRQATDLPIGTAAIVTAQSTGPQTFAASVSSTFSGRGLIGRVGEVIAFSGVLTTTQRRTVEDYLGRKWGVTLTPDAPGTPAAVPGDGTATVSWSAPVYNGGAGLTGYSVAVSPGGFGCSTTGATTCTVAGLTDGQSYTATVNATNSVGTGAASASVPVTPAVGVPGAPTGVATTSANLALTVGWSAPTVTGGSPITGYTATATPGGASCTTTGATTCTVSGLTNGANYSLTVTATNSVGTGPASSAASGVPGGGVSTPGAPGGVTLQAGDTTILATWTAPVITGGALITGYTATANPGGASCATTAATTCTMPGLADGTTYAVTVTATNSAGTGPASTAVSTTPYPASVMAAGGGLSLWLDAADATTLYPTTTCSGANALSSAATGCWRDKSTKTENFIQNTASARPTVAGLNGLSALNLADSQRVLTSFDGNDTYQTVFVAVLPQTNPSTYNTLFGQAGSDFSLRLASTQLSNPNGNDWAGGTGPPPLDWSNGRQATDPGLGATLVVTAQSATPKTFSASVSTTFLTRGMIGTVGEVVAFSTVLTTPQRRAVEDYLAHKWGTTLTPDPPGAPTLNPGDGAATASWAAPAWSGGPAVTGYVATVTSSSGGGSCSTTGPTTCTISGLTNGITYIMSVTAANSVGTGPASATATTTPFPAVMAAGSGLSLWLDGADPTTVYSLSTCTGAIAALGTNVACWKDKSALGENFSQATAALQPVVGTLNGLDAVSFTTVNQTQVLNSLNSSDTYWTLFVAALPQTTGSNFDTLFAQGGGADFGLRLNNNSLSSPNGQDWANSTGTPPLDWSNGRQATDPTLGSTAVITAQSLTSKTFNATVSGGYTGRGMLGLAGEVIAFNTTLTTAQRRAVEDYLAHKWGPLLTPDPPGAPTLTPGPTSLGTSWTPPTWTGGAAITAYTATASPGGATCATTGATTCTINGLTTGTGYTVTVTATNSVGIGAGSSPSASAKAG